MFKEVTDILFYDGEYIQKILFSKQNIGGFEVSALFFGHAQPTFRYDSIYEEFEDTIGAIIFDSQGLRSALLIFTLGIVRRIFEDYM